MHCAFASTTALEARYVIYKNLLMENDIPVLCIEKCAFSTKVSIFVMCVHGVRECNLASICENSLATGIHEYVRELLEPNKTLLTCLACSAFKCVCGGGGRIWLDRFRSLVVQNVVICCLKYMYIIPTTNPFHCSTSKALL